MVRRTDPLFEWFGSASRRVRRLRQSRVPSASRPVARQRATTHESLEKCLNGAEWGGTETSGDTKPATLIKHVRRKHRACLFTHYICYSTPNVLTKVVRRTDPRFEWFGSASRLVGDAFCIPPGAPPPHSAPAAIHTTKFTSSSAASLTAKWRSLLSMNASHGKDIVRRWTTGASWRSVGPSAVRPGVRR